jgi:hypothetical protein
METIIAAKIAAKDFALKAEIQPIERNGHEFYLVAMPRDGSIVKMAAMHARWQWQQYYRAVRTLRALRLEDQKQFKRFSQAWWHGYYKDELRALYPDDGRFGWVNTPLNKRLEWFKLKKKVMS